MLESFKKSGLKNLGIQIPNGLHNDNLYQNVMTLVPLSEKSIILKKFSKKFFIGNAGKTYNIGNKCSTGILDNNVEYS